MFVEFLGDKKGAHLDYGNQFHLTDGETLETTHTDHEIPNMYKREDEDFLRCIETGERNRNHISNILESMKLLDSLYKSSDLKKELEM